MPKLILNGEPKEIGGVRLADILTAEQVPQDHWKALAIARNGSVVPKSQWQDVTLDDGDRIEIVMPFAGG